MVSVKFCHYGLREVQSNDEEIFDINCPSLRDTLYYIKDLGPSEKKREIRNGTKKKFFFQELLREKDSDSKFVLRFKSARYEYRPALIKGQDLSERQNPKEREEGEMEQTHIGFQYGDNATGVRLIMQETDNGVTIREIVGYLNHFESERCKSIARKRSTRYEYDVISTGDFLTNLNRMQTVNRCEVFLSERILGTQFLNLQNRTANSVKEVILEMKANPDSSLVGLARELNNKRNQSPGDFQKIRVYCKDTQGINFVFDTDLVRHIERVPCEVNSDTGELQTTTLFSTLFSMME